MSARGKPVRTYRGASRARTKISHNISLSYSKFLPAHELGAALNALEFMVASFRSAIGALMVLHAHLVARNALQDRSPAIGACLRDTSLECEAAHMMSAARRSVT